MTWVACTRVRRRYAGRMPTLYSIKLFLVAFAIFGIVYSCAGSGFLSGKKANWFESLPKQKKVIFVCAIAATVIQGFL
jgi:hypothetical protein